MAPSKNPIASIAGSLAAVAAGIVATKALESVWNVAFHEPAPTDKQLKATTKQIKKEQKVLNKAPEKVKDKEQDLLTKAMNDPTSDEDLWKILLWAAGSTILIAAARNAGEVLAAKLVDRRPRPNRG